MMQSTQLVPEDTSRERPRFRPQRTASCGIHGPSLNSSREEREPSWAPNQDAQRPNRPWHMYGCRPRRVHGMLVSRHQGRRLPGNAV